MPEDKKLRVLVVDDAYEFIHKMDPLDFGYAMRVVLKNKN